MKYLSFATSTFLHSHGIYEAKHLRVFLNTHTHMYKCSNQHTETERDRKRQKDRERERVEPRRRDRGTESFQLARDMSVICDCVCKDDGKKQAMDFDIICILIFDVFHFTQPFMAYVCERSSASHTTHRKRTRTERMKESKREKANWLKLQNDKIDDL